MWIAKAAREFLSDARGFRRGFSYVGRGMRAVYADRGGWPLLAVPLLGEELSLVQITGGLMILFGIRIVHVSRANQ